MTMFNLTYYGAQGIISDAKIASIKINQNPIKNPSENAGSQEKINQDQSESIKTPPDTKLFKKIKNKIQPLQKHTFKLPDWRPQTEWDFWISRRPKKASKEPSTLNRHIVQLDIIRGKGFDLKSVLTDAGDAGWQGIKSDWTCFDVKQDGNSLADAKSRDLKELREEAERQEQQEKDKRGW